MEVGIFNPSSYHSRCLGTEPALFCSVGLVSNAWLPYNTFTRYLVIFVKTILQGRSVLSPQGRADGAEAERAICLRQLLASAWQRSDSNHELHEQLLKLEHDTELTVVMH